MARKPWVRICTCRYLGETDRVRRDVDAFVMTVLHQIIVWQEGVTFNLVDSRDDAGAIDNSVELKRQFEFLRVASRKGRED